MTKVLINGATDIVLDWLVAKCEGHENTVSKNKGGSLSFDAGLHPYMADLEKPGRFQIYSPSTDWAQGGPIVALHIVLIEDIGDFEWEATAVGGAKARGDTVLQAVCRCYVASKLGDEVDIPEELV